MAVINNNLVFYASSGMPINDTYRSGGEINSGIRVMFTDLDDSTTITTYSNDIRDQNTVLISGWNNSQAVIGESIDVDGTGHTTGSSTFSGILCAKLEHATGTGTITISGTNENIVGRIIEIKDPMYGIKLRKKDIIPKVVANSLLLIIKKK